MQQLYAVFCPTTHKTVRKSAYQALTIKILKDNFIFDAMRQLFMWKNDRVEENHLRGNDNVATWKTKTILS